jgi:hypothetical protein
MEEITKLNRAEEIFEMIKKHFVFAHSYTEKAEDGSINVLNSEKSDYIMSDIYKILNKWEVEDKK